MGNFATGIITENIEMSTRIQDHVFSVEYEPKAVILTEGPADVVGLAEQRLRWKYGRLLTFLRYRHTFFSPRDRHASFLTTFTLPLAFVSDFLLLLEWPILAFMTYYTVSTGNFAPVAIAIVLVAALITFEILTDVRWRRSLRLLFLAPIAWLPILFVDLIGTQALVRSLWRLAKGEGLQWQRHGVFGDQESVDAH